MATSTKPTSASEVDFQVLWLRVQEPPGLLALTPRPFFLIHVRTPGLSPSLCVSWDNICTILHPQALLGQLLAGKPSQQVHVAWGPSPAEAPACGLAHKQLTYLSLCKVTPSGVTEKPGPATFFPCITPPSTHTHLYSGHRRVIWGHCGCLQRLGHPSLAPLTAPVMPAPGRHLIPWWQGQVFLWCHLDTR